MVIDLETDTARLSGALRETVQILAAVKQDGCTSAELERAARRVKDRQDLMWHVATYVIINAFLWFIVPQAAFWVTIGWGIGVAFHVAFYFIGDDVTKSPRYQKYLDEERARDEHQPT